MIRNFKKNILFFSAVILTGFSRVSAMTTDDPDARKYPVINEEFIQLAKNDYDRDVKKSKILKHVFIGAAALSAAYGVYEAYNWCTKPKADEDEKFASDMLKQIKKLNPEDKASIIVGLKKLNNNLNEDQLTAILRNLPQDKREKILNIITNNDPEESRSFFETMWNFATKPFYWTYNTLRTEGAKVPGAVAAVATLGLATYGGNLLVNWLIEDHLNGHTIYWFVHKRTRFVESINNILTCKSLLDGNDLEDNLISVYPDADSRQLAEFAAEILITEAEKIIGYTDYVCDFVKNSIKDSKGDIRSIQSAKGLKFYLGDADGRLSSRKAFIRFANELSQAIIAYKGGPVESELIKKKINQLLLALRTLRGVEEHYYNIVNRNEPDEIVDIPCLGVQQNLSSAYKIKRNLN